MEKTKTMIISYETKIERQDIEQVGMYKHLGGIIDSEGTLEDEINERIA